MSKFPRSRDCIDSTIPVFPVARISKEVCHFPSTHCSKHFRILFNGVALNQTLDTFFSVANAACRACEYEEAQSTLMHSADIAALESRTEPPVAHRLVQNWPFLQFQLSQVIDFALQHLDQTLLSPTNMIVLDERSNEDSTCLLLSRNELSNDAHSFMQARSDFESAVVTLKTIETGCGGADSQLITDYPGSDGVLRISARDCSSR